MTYPPPYSGQFRVPPNRGQGITVDLRTLPPIPPRPRELTLGLYLMNGSAIIYLISELWKLIAMFATAKSGDGPKLAIEAVSPVLSILVVGVGVGVLTYFLRRGSRAALGVSVGWVCLNAILVLAMVIRFTVGVAREQSLPPVIDELLGSPYQVGFLISALVAPTALLGFARRATLSWSHKAEAIRWVRARVDRGAPIHQVPPVVYE